MIYIIETAVAWILFILFLFGILGWVDQQGRDK